MAMKAEHMCWGQSRLTGQSLDGKRAGKMATANVVARVILEDAAVSVLDFLLHHMLITYECLVLKRAR